MEFIADITIAIVIAVAINAKSGHMPTMLSKGRPSPDGQVQREIVGIVGRSEGAIGLPTGAVVLGFAMAVGRRGGGIAIVVVIRTRGLSDEEAAAFLWALLVPNNAISKPGKLTLDLSVKGCAVGGAFAELAPTAELPDNSLRLADHLLRRDDCAPDGPTCTADFTGLP